MKFKSIALLFLSLFLVSEVAAQRGRNSYPALLARAKQANIYVDSILLPGNGEQNATFAIVFRFDNDFLPYKKINPGDEIKPQDGKEYFTSIRLNSEIFEGKYDRKNVNNIATVNSDFWSDTVFVSTFEETQSKKRFVAGHLSTKLEEGEYNYLLQLGLGESVSERNSSRENLRVPDFTTKKTGEVYLVKKVSDISSGKNLLLTNQNDNVEFGKDFYALVRIPEYDASASYDVTINKTRVNRRDTTLNDEVYRNTIAKTDIYSGSYATLAKDQQPTITLNTSDGNHTYAIVKIPNSTFENDTYSLRVLKNGEKRPVARQVVRSFWADMPASLFSLNISIDMLSYILDEERIKDLRKGNNAEKEKKLRAFWKAQDPTPNTVFNELMAEYYRRVDYAYENFSSLQVPGFDNDQGILYIKQGPPDSINRQFPTNGQVLEIWDYGKERFVFEKTSGFGDFKLLTKTKI